MFTSSYGEGQYALIVGVKERSSELGKEVAAFSHMLQLFTRSVEIDAKKDWGEDTALSHSCRDSKPGTTRLMNPLYHGHDNFKKCKRGFSFYLLGGETVMDQAVESLGRI